MLIALVESKLEADGYQMIEKERIPKDSLIREAVWRTKGDYSNDDVHVSLAVRDLISPPTGKIR